MRAGWIAALLLAACGVDEEALRAEAALARGEIEAFEAKTAALVAKARDLWARLERRGGTEGLKLEKGLDSLRDEGEPESDLPAEVKRLGNEVERRRLNWEAADLQVQILESRHRQLDHDEARRRAEAESRRAGRG